MVLVSDNGPCFTGNTFKEFMRKNGIRIRHIIVALHHPVSNRLAERAVQTFKTRVRKITMGTVEDRMNRFLFAYRTINTPWASEPRG